MIAVSLLFFAIVLIVIGGLFGLKRGLVKEGIRLALWIVLFVGSCFFIPEITERILLFVAEFFEITAANTEQLIAELLNKIEWLRKDTYLILPFASMVKSLLVPIVAVLCYWAAWLVSGILFMIVGVFLRNLEFDKKAVSRIGGLIAGCVVALLGGMLTLYPVAKLSTAVDTLNENPALQENVPATVSLEGIYNGTPVQLLYRYTGMEWTAEQVHTMVVQSVIENKNHNLWKQLPNVTALASSALDVMDRFTNEETQGGNLEEVLKEFAENYFLFDFISEEQQITLLNHLKTGLTKNLEDETMQTFVGFIEIKEKEQVVNDVEVYGALYDMLKEENILDALAGEQTEILLTEEFGDELLQKLYLLSNAEKVIPELLNTIYAMLMSGTADELVQPEGFTLNETAKADVEEIVAVMCKLSSLLQEKDTLTLEQKTLAMESLVGLKDNETIGKENYTKLIQALMKMLFQMNQ